MKKKLDELILQELQHINLNIMTLINHLSNNSRDENVKIESSNLIRLTEWNNYHPSPKLNGLRNIIFHADFNGANVFIKKVGKNIWIDQKKFFDWLKTNPTIRPKRDKSKKMINPL